MAAALADGIDKLRQLERLDARQEATSAECGSDVLPDGGKGMFGIIHALSLGIGAPLI